MSWPFLTWLERSWPRRSLAISGSLVEEKQHLAVPVVRASNSGTRSAARPSGPGPCNKPRPRLLWSQMACLCPFLLLLAMTFSSVLSRCTAEPRERRRRFDTLSEIHTAVGRARESQNLFAADIGFDINEPFWELIPLDAAHARQSSWRPARQEQVRRSGVRAPTSGGSVRPAFGAGRPQQDRYRDLVVGIVVAHVVAEEGQRHEAGDRKRAGGLRGSGSIDRSLTTDAFNSSCTLLVL
ncbi:hypothetical protein HNQ87_002957 [Pacificimonas flava]|nr:hypothetical protein [Pacificimonas flava]